MQIIYFFHISGQKIFFYKIWQPKKKKKKKTSPKIKWPFPQIVLKEEFCLNQNPDKLFWVAIGSVSMALTSVLSKNITCMNCCMLPMYDGKYSKS